MYASNLLKPEAITAVRDYLSNLSFARTNQLADENLGLGNDTWVYLAGMDEEHDPKPLYVAVRSFYVATVKKMLKKFPFGDTILKDFGIINPDKVTTYSFQTIKSLAKRFSQLDLAASESIDSLREEFMGFTLSPADHPVVDTYKSATGVPKSKAGVFWLEVGKIMTLEGEPRFPSLARLMAGLLSISCSNANSERGFSILWKIHTDQRPTLKQSTINSLMAVKFNSEEFCFDRSFSQELLTACKKATTLSNASASSSSSTS